MNESVLYLCLAYAGLGVVVLGLNIYSRWPLWVKLGTIAAVTGLYFLTWQSLQGIQGWPAHDTLPRHFIFLASSVHEPNKETGNPGVIQMWVTPITADDQPSRRPRAFAVPYTKALHQEIEQARKGMRNGILQMGTAKRAFASQQATDTRRFARSAQDIELRNLPDPVLPEK
ncbi:MAG: hypothetical protein L0H19_04520 [Salinisphaera sp.]|nr:hypothetical protein [Salinisphaera sp.]MDN5938400.1 hypothetical protein [Salinisphaera sp.]